jgi:hypothetical protein
MKNSGAKQGFSILGIIILVFLGILVISYFNISIEKVVENPATQDNLQYVGGNTKSVWDKYLKDPANYLWHEVWVDIFWKGFISNMERIRDGKPTDLQNAAPTTPVN